MLVAAKNKQDVIEFKALLRKEFDIKDLGDAKKILAIEIYRDRSLRKLWISQHNYVEKLLDRFDMSKAELVSTPIAIYLDFLKINTQSQNVRLKVCLQFCMLV